MEKQRNTLYNVVEVALIYYGLMGKEYNPTNLAKRNLVRKNFLNAKSRNELDKEVLDKTLAIYSEKIMQDFN